MDFFSPEMKCNPVIDPGVWFIFLLPLYCFYFYVDLNKLLFCPSVLKQKISEGLHFKNNIIYRKLLYTIKQWLSFDHTPAIFPLPRQKQSKTQLAAGNPAELILFALLEFSIRLSYFLATPIGFEGKRQIINPEVRSISLQTLPAGLTYISKKESSLGVPHSVSLLISDTHSLSKAFGNLSFKGGW